jgi:cell wall assembly regulator SMI1
MNPRERKLIEKLRERVKDPDRASDEGLAKVSPPAKAQTVDAAEQDLGFPLPELLRTIYTQVGNGGFGPAYGFLGVKGGATDESGKTLVGVYRSLKGLSRENAYWNWPDGLLPLCRLGCGMYSCLDCVRPRAPVLTFDPNVIWVDDDEADKREVIQLWANAFWWEENSFTSWLARWLDDQPEPERTFPSDAWLRKRLWPDDPATFRTYLEALRTGDE